MVKMQDRAEKLIEQIKTRVEAAEKISVDEIKRIAGSLSADDPNIGRPTEARFLYSGGVQPAGDGTGRALTFKEGGIQAWQPTQHMAQGARGSILTISQTEVGRFLESDAVRDALTKSVGLKGYQDAMNGAILPDGTKTMGLWNEASSRFVSESSHLPTHLMAPMPARNSVIIQSEFPTMLDMPKGGLIEGIDRKSFIAMAKDTPAGIQGLRPVIGALSQERMAGLVYGLDANGKFSGVDSTAYWRGDLSHLGQNTASVNTGTTLVTQMDFFGKLDSVSKAETAQGVKILEKAGHGSALSFTKTFGKDSGFVPGLIIGTTAAGASLVMGASPAEASQTFYETAVPYGEAQIKLAQGDVAAAKRAAFVETASNGGCVVGGGVAGGAVTYFSAGAAVPTGITVASAVGGCAVGGVVVGAAAGALYDGSDKIAQGARIVGSKISDTASSVTNFVGQALSLVDDRTKPSTEARFNWQKIYESLPSKMYDGTKDKDPLKPTKLDIKLQPEVQSLGVIKNKIDALYEAAPDGTRLQRAELLSQFISQYDQYSADAKALEHIETYTEMRQAEMLADAERQRLWEEEMERQRQIALNSPNPPGEFFETMPNRMAVAAL